MLGEFAGSEKSAPVPPPHEVWHLVNRCLGTESNGKHKNEDGNTRNHDEVCSEKEKTGSHDIAPKSVGEPLCAAISQKKG
jgi:hypothetical protein